MNNSHPIHSPDDVKPLTAPRSVISLLHHSSTQILVVIFLTLLGYFVVYDMLFTASPYSSLDFTPRSCVASTPASRLSDSHVPLWGLRHQAIEQDVQQLKNNAQIIFVGDSITQQFSEQGIAAWSLFSRWSPINFGLSGDQTQHVLWRILNGHFHELGAQCKVAVLMIGTNNSARQMSSVDTLTGIHAIIKAIKDFKTNIHILLLSIFPRAKLPFASQLNQAVNHVLPSFNNEQQHIHHVNLNSYFLHADMDSHYAVNTTLYAPDLLHLNEKGYEVFAHALLPHIQHILDQTSP